MSFYVNRVEILGNITKAVELQYTSGNIAYAKVNIATNRSVKNQGKWESVADFHQVTVWRKTAEYVAKYGTKGSKIYIEGSLRYRSYESKDGGKKYVTEISVDSAILMTADQGPKSEAGQPQAPDEDTTTPYLTKDGVVPASTYDPANAVNPDDIPF